MWVVSFGVRLPQWVDIKHWRLQLCQLDGCDAHRPDVAKFIVPAFNLHSCDLWGHPEDRRDTAASVLNTNTKDKQREEKKAGQLRWYRQTVTVSGLHCTLNEPTVMWISIKIINAVSCGSRHLTWGSNEPHGYTGGCLRLFEVAYVISNCHYHEVRTPTRHKNNIKSSKKTAAL